MQEGLVNECLFCRIVAGKLPVQRIYEDDLVMGFPDIQPQAPTHILLVPKVHITSTRETMAEHEAALGRLVVAAGALAERLGLRTGYRLIINTGADGGQTVQHLHLHLLGGRAMGWPPG